MIFVRGHRYTRRQAMLACCGWLAGAALVAQAGCGGGGSSDNKSPTPPPTKATLTGRVIDVYNGATGIQGAIFRYNSAEAITDRDGYFTLQADPSAAANARVTGPSLANGSPGYHGRGSVSTLGATYYDLNTTGFPVAATTAGQTVDFGTIRLGNIDGSPFPPF